MKDGEWLEIYKLVYKALPHVTVTLPKRPARNDTRHHYNSLIYEGFREIGDRLGSITIPADLQQVIIQIMGEQ